MQELIQIEAIIKSMKMVIAAMKTKRAGEEDIRNVQLTTDDINHILYHTKKLKFQKEYDLESVEGYLNYIEETESLVSLWEQTIQRRRGKSTDVVFWDTYEYFKYVDTNTIYQAVVKHFMELPEDMRIEYLALPHRYVFLKNKIDFTQGDFSLIAEHVEMMTGKVEKYKWLYEHLADYRSKAVLNGIIRYWFDFDLNGLQGLCETLFSDYYDLDILDCSEDEVVVDLGAFTGDSVLGYIDAYGVYKKIYAYEITPGTYESLVQKLSGYSNIIPMQKGVSSKAGKMFVRSDGSQGAGNRLSDDGDVEVEVVTLDEDITEPVTLIKMDIEGAEKDAIVGAASHIKADRPKMLISSYHLSEDIFEIPCLVNSIRDDYKFYMRFNGHGSIWPCDYVLFAV